MTRSTPPSAASPAPARPAATVILIRNAASGLETLLLRRNAALEFHGGSWVFPGGRIDPADYDPPGEGGPEEDARVVAARAAAREAREEAGLDLDPETLVYFSHWTTPIGLPRRFSTWFYLAPAPDGSVEVDGGEIHDHRWMTPAAALDDRDAGHIALPAPTYVSLLALRTFRTVSDAVSRCRLERPEVYVPRNQSVPGGRLSLYEADAGYESGNYDLPGPRHRLWMLEEKWRYERDL